MRKKKSTVANKAIVVIILLVFSVSIFAVTQFGEEEESISGDAVSISGYSFYEAEGLYITEVEEGFIGFSLNPENVTDVEFNSLAVDKLAKSKIYFAFNPNEEVASYLATSTYDLSNVLVTMHGRAVVGAYTEDMDPIDPNTPLRSCSDASDGVGVIEFRVGEAMVDVEGECVIISGDEDTLELASTKLAMWLAGVEI
jgi:hypothetical protein